jgi:hypothetical protein
VGLLGPRWRLSGLSAITRCAKSLAQDGVQAPVDFFGDTFCMDGARLVGVAATSSLTEFRTENDSFAKILGTKDGNGDFVTFTAYRRDGRIFHYGQTPSSRLHGNPMQFFPSGSTARDAAYAYYLDKIEDRYANSILITYANAVATPTSGVTQVQELEPAQISWGGSGDAPGQRSVTFEYDQTSIPAGSTVDAKHMRWVHGLGIGAAQYLTAINIFGPDGLGGTPLLKQYTFDYTDQPATRTGEPLITGDRVLYTITEGDPANRAWKKSTRIEWESGSLAYSRTVFNASDILLSSYYGPPIASNGQFTNYANQYRRLTVVDLNGDGRDDVVYRAYVSPHHSGFSDCLGWNVRTAQFAPGDTSGIPYLSTPTPLSVLGSDPDTSCRANLISSTEYKNAKAPNAYVGDIAFADLNGDGYPDIISPIGKGSYDSAANKQNSVMVGYRAYLSTGPLAFGNPINFLDSVGQPPSIANFNTPKDATIAIADTWGDGVPTVITRGPANVFPRFNSVKLDGRALVSKTETRSGQTFPYSECSTLGSCYAAVIDTKLPDGSIAAEDLAAIDLDGDGTAEILRNAVSCPAGMNCGPMNGAAMVQSPTMSGFLLLPPATSTLAQIEARWFLDLNGDGLLDVAWAPLGSASIFAALNTGAGFDSPVETRFDSEFTSGSDSFQTGEVMLMDFNLDGRQDLVSAFYRGPDSTMIALLSDGAGGFSWVDTTLPPGSGIPLYNPGAVARPNVIADLNGDGLPDTVNLEGAGPGTLSTVAGYIRQGRAPMMVTKITEGTGRTVEFGHEVSSTKDAFYAVSRAQSCDKDPQHLECLNRGRWLVKSLKIGGADISAPFTQSFTYRGGVSDKRGRGFLGFIQRDIYGPGSRHETITFDPISRLERPVTASVKPYAYPYALIPGTDRVDVDTTQGPNRHHYETVQTLLSGSWRGNGTYEVHPYQVNRRHYDCPTASGSTCSGPARTLLSQSEFLLFDSYGNVVQSDTAYYDGTKLIRTDTDVIKYQSADTTNWLVSLYDSTKPSTRTSSIGSPARKVIRTITLTSDQIHGGLLGVEIEPNGDATTHLSRSFIRDSRGRLSILSETEAATGIQRNTELFYDDADGVFVSRVRRSTGTMLIEDRIWRHPGFGFVVEVDDPNGLAATRSYDTFGRLVGIAEMSGASTAVQYYERPYNGADFGLLPEGRSTRLINVHLDSWGRETARTSPVDATRVLEEDVAYDGFGRVQTRTVKSGPASSPTNVLNTSTYSYDDLGRCCRTATSRPIT